MHSGNVSIALLKIYAGVHIFRTIVSFWRKIYAKI
jgi:hypothetical protein